MQTVSGLTPFSGRRLLAIASPLVLSAALFACGGSSGDGNDAPASGGSGTGSSSSAGSSEDSSSSEGSSSSASSQSSSAAEVGLWTTGDLHSHTVQSDDADVSQTLDLVLGKAFTSYSLDWLAVTNHLRSSSRDNNGTTLSAAIPYAVGMASYEIPRIQALQAAGSYAGKTIFSMAEWDMPTHDHANIGLFKTDAANALSADTDGFRAFQYLFTSLSASMFDSADIAAWQTRYATTTRRYTTADDALAAISWLKTYYPDTSFLQLNHPSRKPAYTISDLRTFNDMAPDIFFTIEGMPGNQMEPNRGGYDKDYTDAFLVNRTYGGADYYVAKVGGVWDALLGEGRHIWNTANSDTHFKTTTLYSSGYFPGEYAKNHVWTADTSVRGILAGVRSGRMFSAFGDLINALDFTASSQGASQHMGGELKAAAGSTVTLTIRFRSPASNNYENPINSGNFVGVPVVDHVDLISGEVTAKAAQGSSAYSVATNASTQVVKRFTSADWTTDAEGYHTVTFTTTADTSRYFRLRGTNLGTDVSGLTVNGEPQADLKITTADNTLRFNEINDREYASLWFYSNPIFVMVQ